MNQDQLKQNVAKYAAGFVDAGMTVGIGTGSTAHHLLIALAERMKQGLQFRGVPTSSQTLQQAIRLNIPMIDLDEAEKIDIAIDGADEISPELNLLKGGGGAFLQEKMVAFAAEKFIVIADESKLVERLGKFPLPVEVVPYGIKRIERHIEALGCKQASIRRRNNEIFITDHGHYILDCHFNSIADPHILNTRLKEIPGVVENGLFIRMAGTAIIGYADGTVKEMSRHLT